MKKFILSLAILSVLGLGCTERPTALDNAREKRLLESEVFDRKLQCHSLLTNLRKNYPEIYGTYYDEPTNSCFIRYTTTAGIERATDIQHLIVVPFLGEIPIKEELRKKYNY